MAAGIVFTPLAATMLIFGVIGLMVTLGLGFLPLWLPKPPRESLRVRSHGQPLLGSFGIGGCADREVD
jgi:hypothetical protein